MEGGEIDSQGRYSSPFLSSTRRVGRICNPVTCLTLKRPTPPCSRICRRSLRTAFFLRQPRRLLPAALRSAP